MHIAAHVERNSEKTATVAAVHLLKFSDRGRPGCVLTVM
jgi:hypothetical protein